MIFLTPTPPSLQHLLKHVLNIAQTHGLELLLTQSILPSQLLLRLINKLELTIPLKSLVSLLWILLGRRLLLLNSTELMYPNKKSRSSEDTLELPLSQFSPKPPQQSTSQQSKSLLSPKGSKMLVPRS